MRKYSPTDNELIDKFVHHIYGIDMWITGTDGANNLDKLTVMVFADKFLRNSNGYSPEYSRMVGDMDRLLKIAYGAFKSTGVDPCCVAWDYIKYILSDDMGSYFKNYLDNAIALLPQFIESKGEKVTESNFKIGKSFFVGTSWEFSHPPFIWVDVYTKMWWLDEMTNENNFDDFLKENMKHDSQIRIRLSDN